MLNAARLATAPVPAAAGNSPGHGRHRAPESMLARYLRLMGGDQPVHTWPVEP